MGRYDNDENYTGNGAPRQRDLVLSTNEFCFIQSKTNGQIKTYTGPIMVTISQQESMVVFNNKTKRFEETGDFEKARQIFTSAPEGWYVVLKNPAKDFTSTVQFFILRSGYPVCIHTSFGECLG